jgi:hypothetical protein
MKELSQQLIVKFNSRVLQNKNRLEEKLKNQSGSAFIRNLIVFLIMIAIDSIIMVVLNKFFPDWSYELTCKLEKLMGNGVVVESTVK